MSTIQIIRITGGQLFFRSRTQSSDRFIQGVFEEIIDIDSGTFIGRRNASKKIHTLFGNEWMRWRVSGGNRFTCERFLYRFHQDNWSRWSIPVTINVIYRKTARIELWISLFPLTSASSSKISKRMRQYSNTHSTTHVQSDFMPSWISLEISLGWSAFWIFTLNVTPEGRAKKLLWSRIRTVLFRWWSIAITE